MSSSHFWAPCMPQHFAQITLKELCFTRKSHAKCLQSVWRCTCLLENLACKRRTHSSPCFPRCRSKTWHAKQEFIPVHAFPGAVWKPGTQNKNSFQSMFSQGAGWKPGMQNKNSFQSICPVHVFPGAGKGKNTGPHAGENVDNTTENSGSQSRRKCRQHHRKLGSQSRKGIDTLSPLSCSSVIHWLKCATRRKVRCQTEGPGWHWKQNDWSLGTSSKTPEK